MSVTTITEKLSVSPQPSIEEIKSLRDKGYKTLINNRPDHEEPSQLGTLTEQQEAKYCKLSYAFIPVKAGTITEADVRAFQHAIEKSNGPVLAHCKTGTRSISLYLIGEVLDGRMSANEAVEFGRSHGFDTNFVTGWLIKHAERRPQVKGFFDTRTWSVQYVVSDPMTGKCAIIDPVLDFDAEVLFSPGHTLASVTYVIGDAAFVHDTLFMPDSGTARADFPGGDARILWKSIQDIVALPDDMRIFTGHDYQPNGRAVRWESTVAEQKKSNLHLAGVSEEEFVAMRTKRDQALPMPKLILHALQLNICGGRLPKPEINGKRYLKFPLDALQGAVWE